MASQEEVTSLVFCVSIERRDGAGVALTSHDRALLLGSTMYEAAPGFTPAAIIRTEDATQDNTELNGVLHRGAMSEEDLLAGRWDDATVTFFAVSWEKPANTRVPLLCGKLGEVRAGAKGFEADMIGCGVDLNSAPCPATAPECRASLGDRACRVDLAGRALRTELSLAEGSAIQVTDPVDGRFVLGTLRWLSGRGSGLQTTVLGVEDGRIQLRDRPPAGTKRGDRVLLIEGCDKRLATCAERFNNAANFRGEPHLPGSDLLTRYPGG